MLINPKRLAAILALASWLASSGITWDFLQVVAWANMSRGNAIYLSTSDAISKTLVDKPCSLCKVVQRARSATESSPVDKTEVLKSKLKYDYNFTCGVFLVLPEPSLISSFPARFVLVQLTDEVPVPPPKV